MCYNNYYYFMINPFLILIMTVMQCHITWQRGLQVNYVILQIFEFTELLDSMQVR